MPSLEAILHDLRYGLRLHMRRPLFLAVCVFSLAIGVGAVTAVVAASDALLRRPLPGIGQTDLVVELGRTRDGRGFDTFSFPDLQDVKDGVPALQHVGAYNLGLFSLGTEQGGERITGALVDSEYFASLGVQAAMGRVLSARDLAYPGGESVAVLSDAFWRTRLGSDPAVVGRTIRLNRHVLSVVGVLPPEFRSHIAGISTDVYVPLGLGPILGNGSEAHFSERGINGFQSVGRLAPGSSVALAQSQIDQLFVRLAEAYPETNGRRAAKVIPLGPVPGAGRGLVRGFLAAMAALVTLVLLATCINVAGMFLSRSLTREREVAIRMALGSGRTRLIRQLMIETLIVFVLGGAGGIAIASIAISMIDLSTLPVPIDIRLDLRPGAGVLFVAGAGALLLGLGFGVLPAVRATRPDLVPALKGDAGTGMSGRSRLRTIFVTAQLAVSLVLLFSAGLFLKTLDAGKRAGDTFDPDGRWVTFVNASIEGYEEAAGRRLAEQLLERLDRDPGVRAASLSLDLPLDMGRHGTGVLPLDLPAGSDDESLGVDFNVVSPDYFRTMGIRVRSGRSFTSEDRAGGELVAIVSATLAERVWPGGDPLGKRLRWDGPEGPVLTVMGVVDDVKNQAVSDEPYPFVYRPMAQTYVERFSVVVHSAAPGSASRNLVRTAVRDVDPSISLTPVLSMAEFTSVGMLPQRFGAAATTLLGLVALLLCAVGVYGVLAFTVHLRTREIGLRMALGARTVDVVRLVAGGVSTILLFGAGLGLVLVWVVSRLLSGLVLSARAYDPLALGGSLAVLALAVALAALAPTLKAVRTEPAVALRDQ